MPRRLRALALVPALLLALAGCTGHPAVAAPQPPVTPPSTGPSSSAPVTGSASAAVPVTYPASGGRTWSPAAAEAGTTGRHGRLLRYRVLVERDIHGIGTAAFADAVSTTLADPRGWTAGGTLRLHRVGPGQPYDFTIYLATPGTRDSLCVGGDGYTSCRNKDRVVLNVARWVKGVPHYGADLTTYREYMVNHEVGHRLGHGHELCPGPGRLAPVMQQQTLGRHGCLPNAWPYPDGQSYAGRSGVYNDPVPPRDTGLDR